MFDRHKEGCSPAVPCEVCQFMAWVKSVMSPGHYEVFVKRLRDLYEVPPASPAETDVMYRGDPAPEQDSIFKDLPDADPAKDVDLGGTPLEQLPFATRSYRNLKNAGYHSVEQVEAASDAELLRCISLGQRSLKNIRETIAVWRGGSPPPPTNAGGVIKFVP